DRERLAGDQRHVRWLRDDRRRRALRHGERGHAAVGIATVRGADPVARRDGDRTGEEDRAEVEVLVRGYKLSEELLVGGAAEERGHGRGLLDGRGGAMQKARKGLLHVAADRCAGVENAQTNAEARAAAELRQIRRDFRRARRAAE